MGWIFGVAGLVTLGASALWSKRKYGKWLVTNWFDALGFVLFAIWLAFQVRIDDGVALVIDWVLLVFDVVWGAYLAWYLKWGKSRLAKK